MESINNISSIESPAELSLEPEEYNSDNFIYNLVSDPMWSGDHNLRYQEEMVHLPTNQYQEVIDQSDETSHAGSYTPYAVPLEEPSASSAAVVPGPAPYPGVSLPTPQAGPAPPLPGPPDQMPDSGPYNFSVKVTTPSSNKCVMSTLLNKVFVDIDCDVPLQFQWEGTGDRTMAVRAGVVFVDEENAQRPVHCCLQHRAPDQPDEVSLNVLRSSRALGTPGVHYQRDASLPAPWYSVVVEMPAGTRRAHAYRFACKNSCSSGINRRNIGIVFTLEDSSGVVGRQAVKLRVCSCPRRDCDKEEEAVSGAPRKRRLPAPPALSKKIKREPSTNTDPLADAPLVHMQPVRLVNSDIEIAALHMIEHMTRQYAALAPGRRAAADASLADVAARLHELRRDR